MAQKEQIDQDALAAEWGQALDAETAAPGAAAVGSEEAGPPLGGRGAGGARRRH